MSTSQLSSIVAVALFLSACTGADVERKDESSASVAAVAQDDTRESVSTSDPQPSVLSTDEGSTGLEPAESRGPAEEKVTSLTGGETSLEALVEHVLEAVKAKDVETLKKLRVTRREYLDILFPEFDVARDPRHTLSPEFHWGTLDTKSAAGTMEAIANYGGRDFELLEIIVTRGVEDYGVYKLHRKLELRLRAPGGREGTAEIIGSVVEHEGVFKVLSYPS